MPKPRPDRALAAELLDRHWKEVVEEGESADSTSVLLDDATKARIDRVLGSGRVAFSYCLPTQLLGKLTDHTLDALCLQRGDDDDSPGKWDPRSFATKVIVPWVRDNENVLGKSPDPYVSNPLRQARILPSPPNVRSHTLPLWADLHSILSSVEDRGEPEYTSAVFREVLGRIYAKLRDQHFSYPVLRRLSLEQTVSLVREFVKASSEGEHTMSLMAALLTVRRQAVRHMGQRSPPNVDNYRSSQRSRG